MTLPYYESPNSYIYSITNDFGGEYSIVCWDREIRATGIGPGLVGVFTEEGNDETLAHFTAPLDTAGETILNATVLAHDPYCTIENEDTDTQIIAPKDGDVLSWDSTAGAWVNSTPEVDVTTPESLWGSLEADGIEDDTSSSTTSSTFQVKLTIVVPGTTGAKFRIGYCMEFNSANNNKSVEVDLYNSTDDIIIAANRQQTNNSANYFSFAGFHYEDMTGTPKTFQLRYRAIGTTCTVRGAAIEFWRVE